MHDRISLGFCIFQQQLAQKKPNTCDLLTRTYRKSQPTTVFLKCQVFWGHCRFSLVFGYFIRLAEGFHDDSCVFKVLIGFFKVVLPFCLIFLDHSLYVHKGFQISYLIFKLQQVFKTILGFIRPLQVLRPFGTFESHSRLFLKPLVNFKPIVGYFFKFFGNFKDRCRFIEGPKQDFQAIRIFLRSLKVLKGQSRIFQAIRNYLRPK